MSCPEKKWNLLAVLEGCETTPGPAKACSRPDGQTAQGLCDMIGNLREMTRDDYHLDYEGAPSDNSVWLAPSNAGEDEWQGSLGTPKPAKAVRDHSWMSEPPDNARWRHPEWPWGGHSTRGFRVLREARP